MSGGGVLIRFAREFVLPGVCDWGGLAVLAAGWWRGLAVLAAVWEGAGSSVLVYVGQG